MYMNLNLSESKSDTTLIGVFFIVATLTAILGVKLYDPLLSDSNFLVTANENYNRIVSGCISELVLVITASGTGILLYPYLKHYQKSLGLGHLVFRMLEVLCIVLGIVAVLAVLSISELYCNGTITDKTNAQNMGLVFKSIHSWTFIIGPNFMLAINTFLYSYVFYKSRSIPVALSVSGLVASCLILLAALLELFGIIQQISFWGFFLAFPIALYEMVLAIWLIVKGFK